MQLINTGGTSCFALDPRTLPHHRHVVYGKLPIGQLAGGFTLRGSPVPTLSSPSQPEDALWDNGTPLCEPLHVIVMLSGSVCAKTSSAEVVECVVVETLRGLCHWDLDGCSLTY